ncbi:MAG: superoxide dismutase, Ni [Deltaproteobacteria bacterium]|nr:superoxide dismutase, Ni [Deltaproteobacteria bacterium]|tara:strand:- start:4788 stop:5291 length:504 start_codon:yes stop_codon:yes gene_type:complete
MKDLINYLDNKGYIESVSAHCDIPCKIYDPIVAQIGVLTMIRVVDLIGELNTNNDASLTEKAQFSRLVAQKEEHGLKVKEDIRVIWGDYFKTPQFEKFPEIHDLTHSIMLNCSKAKQNISREACVQLLEKVNRFAEIFWLSKDISVFKKECPYPPQLELVYPDLKSK